MNDLDTVRTTILGTALPLAAERGWTADVLVEAAASANIDAPLAARAFPHGAIDAVTEFHAWADRAMAGGLAEHDLRALRMRERVALAVRLRLEALAPHREAARRALAVQVLPTNAAAAAASVYATADAIWRALGDRAGDFSFYSKRAMLAGVCAATFVAWLTDDSTDGAVTWAFLDRRIAEVMALGAAKTNVTKAAGETMTTLRRAVSRMLPPVWPDRPSGGRRARDR